MLCKLCLLLPLTLLAGRAGAALVGTSIAGSLTFSGDPANYFDPGYGFVPGSDLNAAGTNEKISNSAVEFGYNDGASLIAANFTDNTLAITDLIEVAGVNNGFEMTFTDPAFANENLTLTGDSFPLSGYSLKGDELTILYAGGKPAKGQTLTADFSITPEAPVTGYWVLSLAIIFVLRTGRRLTR